MLLHFRGLKYSRLLRHENPLGLPKRPAEIPRMSKGLPIKQRIPGVKKILLVSSGKGGVGKSTVSTNIAMGLNHLGKRVGILDADIFGPSIPRMMKLKGEPRMSDNGKLLPLTNYGVQSMSMGYMIEESNPIVWRGLMVMKALQQLLFEVEWDNLDYLVIDMPPGTGDTQLTISQQLKVDGSIIVSTPQDIALLDAVKGITMFNKVNIPIVGLVQNMSHYICPNCNHESHIFGTEGTRREAKKHDLELLGLIPIHEDICTYSDSGKPIVVAEPEGKVAGYYLDISRRVVEKMEM